MTSKLTTDRLDTCANEEISIPWLIRDRAVQSRNPRAAKACLAGIAETYARTLVGEQFRDSSYHMNFALVEESIQKHQISETERAWLFSKLYERVGNEYYWQGDSSSARDFYRRALQQNVMQLSIVAKIALLALGRRGEYLRKKILAMQ
jgi:hypothetical protein